MTALADQNRMDDDAIEAREEGGIAPSAVKAAAGGAGVGGDGVGTAGAESVASEVSFTVSEAVINKMTELVDTLFVVEEKTPPPPANAFNPVELDPGYKSSNITLNPQAPRTLSGKGGAQQILCKKGLLVQPGSGSCGYFEVWFYSHWHGCQHRCFGIRQHHSLFIIFSVTTGPRGKEWWWWRCCYRLRHP